MAWWGKGRFAWAPPSLWVLTLVLALVHLGLAGRYDAFRNELYFIICGRHPAFGYVDQPPLVPLLAAATQMFGNSVWLLHLPAALAAIALVPLTAALAVRLGGGPVAAWIAGLAAGIALLLVGTSTILTTATFEPLCWTAVAYLLTRAVAGDDRALLGAGLVAGLGLEAKYGMAIWLIALGIGLIATEHRVLLWRGALWGAVGIGLVIAAPSLIWQAVHGWPFFDVINHGRAVSNFTGTPIRFMIHQMVAINPLLAPLFLTGLIAPFAVPRLATARFLAIGYIVAAAIVIVGHGKDYYMAGAYPTLFAVGAVAVEGINPWARRAWFTAATALTLVAAPVVLPILDPPMLERYLDATHLRPVPEEKAAIGAPLTQVFSDELGWRIMESQVAQAYHALSPADQAHTAIITADYGEAAALDYYGAADGLPPALSGQNQYFLWGTHGYDGSILLFVNGAPERWARFCETTEIAGHIGAPFVMPYEQDRPIILCRGLKRGLAVDWPDFRRYQ